MGMDPALIAEVAAKMNETHDNRPVICACGHAEGKHHVNARGVMQCNGRKANCSCRELFGVVKVPNARMFMYKGDERGSAVAKGVAKTYEIEMGHRVEWLIDLVCLEPGCGSGRMVDFVEVDGGKTYTMKCAEHR